MSIRNLFKSKSKEEKALAAYVKDTFNIYPNDTKVYKVAFTHSSVLARSKKYLESNERLEFLGDAILDSIVANYLFRMFPKSPEGELTKLKAKVVSRRNLNAIAKKINIKSQVIHSINSDSQNTSILGNALEALIGALYLDLGYNKCEKAVMKLLEGSDLDQVLFEQKDYKSLMHEWCQHHKKEVLFPAVKELMIDNRIHYEVNAVLEGKVLGVGVATSKKKAQQIAAKEAYYKINED